MRNYLERLWLWLSMFPLPRPPVDLAALYAAIDDYRQICEHPLEAQTKMCILCGATLWNGIESQPDDLDIVETLTLSSNKTILARKEKQNANNS